MSSVDFLNSLNIRSVILLPSMSFGSAFVFSELVILGGVSY